MPQNSRAVNGLVASTTQTQAGGTVLDAGTRIFRAITVASAADAFTVGRKAVNGADFIFINAAAANACGLFPAPGDNFNAAAANAVLSVAANKTVHAFCAVDGTWNTILTA